MYELGVIFVSFSVGFQSGMPMRVPRLLPITHLPIGLLSSDFYPSHFYPSRLLPITGLSSKKDFYPLGHSPISLLFQASQMKKQKMEIQSFNLFMVKQNKMVFPGTYCEQCHHQTLFCIPICLSWGSMHTFLKVLL